MSELTENSHLQSNIKMPVIRGEIALIVIILINSLGVVLMLYSGSGISAISSVPYAFSLVFPKIYHKIYGNLSETGCEETGKEGSNK